MSTVQFWVITENIIEPGDILGGLRCGERFTDGRCSVLATKNNYDNVRSLG